MSELPETQLVPEGTQNYQPGAPQPGQAGGTLGRFQLREALGQGAFGTVYRAFDPVLERDVALKVPRRDPGDPALLERFLREARSAARLHHPSIVTIFDCGQEGDVPYIAMEFVEGSSLAQRLASERPGPRQAAQWIRDLALALEYAHSQKILHRDIKPANIMIDRHGRARLMDFGLAKRVEGAGDPEGTTDPLRTRQGVILGTPAYMAPEQARGDVDAIGPASDQYSLGVVLYEMLTGRRPFGENALEALLAQVADPEAAPPRPRDLAPDLPLALEAIVSRAIRKNPAERYASVADLAVDLQRWLSGDAVAAPYLVQVTLTKRCPHCKKVNKPQKACLYCGTDLRSAALEESAAPPLLHNKDDQTQRAEREYTPGRKPAQSRSGLLVLIALFLGIPALLTWNYLQRKADYIDTGKGGVTTPSDSVVYPHWRGGPGYVTSSGGSREPTFWETIPIVGKMGDLGKGILLGLAVSIWILFRSRR